MTVHVSHLSRSRTSRRIAGCATRRPATRCARTTPS
jgi:hypothetical protein